MKGRVLFAYEEDIKGMGVGWQFCHMFKKPPRRNAIITCLHKVCFETCGYT